MSWNKLSVNPETLRVLVLATAAYALILSLVPISTQAAPDALFKITLVAPGTANQARRQWAQIVRGTFQQVGIEAHVVYMGWGAVFDRILFAAEDLWEKTFDEGGYDALFVGYGWTIPFPIANFLTQYGNGTGAAARAFFPPGPNWYYFEDEYYSRLNTEYLRTTSEARRIEVLKEMQRYLHHNGPDFIIFYDRTVAAYSPKISNFDPIVYYAPAWWKGPREITVAEPGEPTAFNYVLSNSWYDVPFLFALNDMSNGNMITMDYAKNFRPSTVTSWTSSADGKVWTINLRHGVEWHTGEELTADDFLFQLWAQYTPETGTQSLGYFSAVIGTTIHIEWQNGTETVIDQTPAGVPTTHGYAEAVDKYTLRITLPETYGLFYPETFWAPLPKHVLEWVAPAFWATHSFNTGVGEYEVTLSDGTTVDWVGPVGLGPYIFERYDPVRQVVTVKKNLNYWNKTGLEALGLFQIETINVQYIAEKEAALAALKAGEVDILDFNYHFEKDIARFEPSWGLTIVYDAFGLQELGLNMKHPVWGTGTATPLGQRDPTKAKEAALNVRRAIDHLIPRQLIIDSLMDGFPRLGVTFVLPPQVGFDGTIVPTTYDIEEAKQHLAAAGYEIAGYTPVQFQPPAVPSFVLGMPVVLSGKFVNGSTGQPFALPLRVEIQHSADGRTFTKIGETATDAFGNFQYAVVPPTAGDHWYKAYFPGNAIPIAEWIAIVGGALGEVYPTELLELIPPLSTAAVKVTVSALSSVIDPLSAQISTLQAQVASLNSQVVSLQADITSLKGQISTLNTLLYGAIGLIIVVAGVGYYMIRRQGS